MAGSYLSASRSWAVKLSSGVDCLGMFWGAAAVKEDRAKRPVTELMMALADMVMCLKL